MPPWIIYSLSIIVPRARHGFLICYSNVTPNIGGKSCTVSIVFGYPGKCLRQGPPVLGRDRVYPVQGQVDLRIELPHVNTTRAERQSAPHSFHGAVRFCCRARDGAAMFKPRFSRMIDA